MSLEIGGPIPVEVRLSNNRKVASVVAEGKYDRPTIANSFGLPAGETCPGKTPFCDSCYAAGIEGWSNVALRMQHNYDALLNAETVEGMERLLVGAVDNYHQQVIDAQIPQKDWVFRIHWDGDFFSKDYAQAWANTMGKFPEITFWAYTRSFVEPVNVVPFLADIENLVLYLSVDEYNREAAFRVLEDFPDVSLAGCADDFSRARDLLGDRKSLVCPENSRKIPLVRNGKGACLNCRYCINDRGDVLFATSKSEVHYPSRQFAFPIDLVSIIQGREPRPSNGQEKPDPIRSQLPGFDELELDAV